MSLTQTPKPELERRGFLRGLGFIACAPVIVRASSLMAVRPFVEQLAADDGSVYGRVFGYDGTKLHLYASGSGKIASGRVLPDKRIFRLNLQWES